MLKKILRNRINFMIISAIVLLYVTFLTMDIFIQVRSLEASSLKFTSIVLCLLLAINLARNSGDKTDSKYVVVALFFTMIADIFLLFNLSHFAGVATFCVVQLIYIKRYHRKLFIFALIIATLIPPAIFFLPFEPLHVLAGAYAIFILTTFFATFKAKLPAFNLKCIRLGMLLFILCDLHVALYNQLSSSSSYYSVAAILMWVFYLPAQVLLTLSAYHQRKYR